MRTQIDNIDIEILALIEKREQCVAKVAAIKESVSETPVYYCPEREQIILKQMSNRYKGSFPIDVIRDIFQTIIANCRLLEEKQL